MTDLCPVCDAELASVTLVGPTETVRVGSRCARLLEMLLRLAGADDVRRRPVLRVLS